MPVAPELGLLFNALPRPYLLLSPELVIEAVSDAYLAATLTQRAGLVGQYMFDVFPDNPLAPEAQAVHNLHASLRQVLAMGQPHEMAQQHYDVPDPAHPGQFVERHWQPLNAPVLDAQGQVVQLIHSVLDVTAQVQAQAHLHESQAAERAARAEAERQQALLYRVLEQAPAMICILQGPQHVFQFVNPLYQALVGERPLLGRPFAEAFPELAGQGIYEPLDQLYRTGESFYANEQLAQIDHTNTSPSELEKRYYNFVWQARRDQAGAVDGILVFAHEVTEQVQARQQVEQLNAELEDQVQARTCEMVAARAETERQRAQLASLFQQAPAAICILNGPELVYELVNPGYQQLFPGRALLGKPILTALPEIAGNRTYTTFRQVYDTGQTQEEQALLIPLARPTDGVLEDRYFRYIQQARYAANGQIDGVLVFAFEVTAQVQTRQQLQVLNEELRKSNTLLTRTNVDLDTFVYTASHDLRAPITNIESIILALRDTLPPAVQQDDMVAHLLELLNTTVARFQFTIGQLTDITRLQLVHAGPAEPVNLAEVLESVRLDLAPAILASGNQLITELALDLVVSFSPANLRSIIYNLLSNAVKYRAFDRPAQVRVHASQTAQGVVLTVQDNGLGMSEVQQRQLFGLFQRLHTHVEGTGVGLFITKRLVENAGGTITVQSQPDTGTTFTVTFPA